MSVMALNDGLEKLWHWQFRRRTGRCQPTGWPAMEFTIQKVAIVSPSCNATVHLLAVRPLPARCLSVACPWIGCRVQAASGMVYSRPPGYN